MIKQEQSDKRITFFFKLAKLLSFGDRDFKTIPIKDQKAFLEQLGEPKDDIDRSYKQYLCHQFASSNVKGFFYNFISLFAIPIFVFYYLIKGIFIKKGECVVSLVEDKKMEEVIPASVIEKYHPDSRFWKSRSSLAFRDLGFIFNLVARGWKCPYFVLRVLVNVSFYSEMIRSHQPKVVIAFMEYSYSSSALTAFCHRYGVKHINIMHGEKIYKIREAFFHFDECYVWHQHYIDLFVQLKAEPNQFHIELPLSIKIDCRKYRNLSAYADYKYYLQYNKPQEVESIINSMQFVLREGKTLKFRPHPRYSDMELLRKLLSNDQIEDVKKVPITESLANLGCAVSMDSTVLVQAYFSGIECMLDDVTYKEKQEHLAECGYILSCEKDVKRLSEKQ